LELCWKTNDDQGFGDMYTVVIAGGINFIDSKYWSWPSANMPDSIKGNKPETTSFFHYCWALLDDMAFP